MASPLETIRVTLQSAMRLVENLVADPLLARFIEAFHLLPSEDRAVIVGVVEGEARARRRARGTDDLVGWTLHPNPNARLYTRALTSHVPGFELEHDAMMLSTLRALKVIPLLLSSEIHAVWRSATQEALEHLDDDARRASAELLREALALIEAAETAAADREDVELASLDAGAK